MLQCLRRSPSRTGSGDRGLAVACRVNSGWRGAPPGVRTRASSPAHAAPGVRIASATVRELVLEKLRAAKGPTLPGGDFNVSRHESPVRQSDGAGYRTVQTAEVTWRRRPCVLDHIFHSRHLRPVRHEMKPALASDHHMLVVQFEFVD